MIPCVRFIPALLLSGLLLASCLTPASQTTYHIVTSQSQYSCCRTTRYSTFTFPDTRSTTSSMAGVSLRLMGDTIRASCDADAEVGVVIANNSDLDIFVPVSNELQGKSIKLYPWRTFYDMGAPPVKLARQLPYNDLVESESGELRFVRLPSGREVELRGVITPRWLCSTGENVGEEFLAFEMNPVYHAERLQALRGARYQRDSILPPTIGFRYDVAYTTLRYLDSLPVLGRQVSPGGDTIQVQIAVTEEPLGFLVSSFQVVESNVSTLVFR